MEPAGGRRVAGGPRPRRPTNGLDELIIMEHHHHHRHNLDLYNAKLQSSGVGAAAAATHRRLAYKSVYFLPVSFVLVALTLLPLQYHAENFGIQMKKMLDSCADSAGLFNENQTQILDTLFPYGFVGSSASGFGQSLGGRGSGNSNPTMTTTGSGFEQLLQELAVIDEIHRRQMSDTNLTIKYLTQADCLSKNYTSILNLITIASPVGVASSSSTPMVPTSSLQARLLLHRPGAVSVTIDGSKLRVIRRSEENKHIK